MCYMGTSSTPQRGTAPPPQFSAHVRCAQMAGWIKMPLGKEEGLDSGDIVLYGDPTAPTKWGHSSPPTFCPMSVVAKRLDG